MKNLENLMYAIKNNDVDKCREFLKNNDVYLDRRLTVGDNIHVYTTPLTFAARYGNIQIIRMLLKAGADPNFGIINESRLRPLSEAVIHKRDNDVVKVLIEAGADVNYNEQFSSIPTVLHVAVRDNRIELIKILLAAGADPNTKPRGQSYEILHDLIGKSKKPLKEKIEIAGLLINAGADINEKNRSGMTPLHYAKSKALIKFLIENGADPRIANKRGRQIIDSPGVEQVYMEYIMSRVKLANAKQRLAFATMLISPNHNDKPEAVIAGICQSLDMPPFDVESKDKANAMLIKQLQQELQEEIRKEVYKSLRGTFKGEPINDMVEFYRRQLQNPNLLPEHRKELRRKKRTRKLVAGIPLGSSDRLSTSRQSRSSPSEELRQAVSLSLQALKSNRSSSRKSRSVKSSSSIIAQLQQAKDMGLSDKEIIDVASEGVKKKSRKKSKKSRKKSK
tara:strand:- start:386 stop:1735 length:1350 start_codon:yes stop_codon:yes gene_type:complete